MEGVDVICGRLRQLSPRTKEFASKDSGSDANSKAATEVSHGASTSGAAPALYVVQDGVRNIVAGVKALNPIRGSADGEDSTVRTGLSPDSDSEGMIRRILIYHWMFSG